MNDHNLSRGTAFQFLCALMIGNSVGHRRVPLQYHNGL
jgi:hypothetical protein